MENLFTILRKVFSRTLDGNGTIGERVWNVLKKTFSLTTRCLITLNLTNIKASFWYWTGASNDLLFLGWTLSLTVRTFEHV